MVWGKQSDYVAMTALHNRQFDYLDFDLTTQFIIQLDISIQLYLIEVLVMHNLLQIYENDELLFTYLPSSVETCVVKLKYLINWA